MSGTDIRDRPFELTFFRDFSAASLTTERYTLHSLASKNYYFEYSSMLFETSRRDFVGTMSLLTSVSSGKVRDLDEGTTLTPRPGSTNSVFDHLPDPGR